MKVYIPFTICIIFSMNICKLKSLMFLLLGYRFLSFISPIQAWLRKLIQGNVMSYPHLFSDLVILSVLGVEMEFQIFFNVNGVSIVRTVISLANIRFLQHYLYYVFCQRYWSVWYTIRLVKTCYMVYIITVDPYTYKIGCSSRA